MNYFETKELHLKHAKKILRALRDYGPYIYHDKGVSIYIHFTKVDHKLRISNHEERARYGYKWQLRTEPRPRFANKPHCNYHTSVKTLVRHFKNYYAKVQPTTEQALEGL